MMGVLSWYTSYVEQGIFCTTLKKDPAGLELTDVWNAISSLKRFDHFYHLGLEEKIGKTGERKEAKVTLAIEKFFDDNGKLLYDRVSREVERLHSDIKHKRN
ncbi:putative signal peptidase complex subunit 2 [Armadillidium nasatum]|uniref:Signal peptidase complex subunit 2 n=1 Tax=Armadillidium nasatum TaxID=96803 RepID=A0A5N5TNS2_9CRUS|nr:putative signal peptidase complex subunit 2 [Armadillidium nasatum]